MGLGGFLRRSARRVGRAAREEAEAVVEDVQDELDETRKDIINIGRRRVRRVVGRAMQPLRNAVSRYVAEEHREAMLLAIEDAQNDIINNLLRRK